MHDKLVEGAACPGRGPTLPSQAPTLCCWVLSRAKDRQLTCAAPQHVPAGVCPAQPGASIHPRSGSMQCPAAWLPSGPSGLSTPAAGCAALLQSQHLSETVSSSGLPNRTLSDTCWLKGATEACAAPGQHQICRAYSKVFARSLHLEAAAASGIGLSLPGSAIRCVIGT